jgi:hypothetical protein
MLKLLIFNFFFFNFFCLSIFITQKRKYSIALHVEDIVKKLFFGKKTRKIFETLDKEKNIQKKKAKLFYSVFFQGESISNKKKLKKLCRVNFEVRAP